MGKIFYAQIFWQHVWNFLRTYSFFFHSLLLCWQEKFGAGTGSQNMDWWFIACLKIDTVNELADNIKAITVNLFFYRFYCAKLPIIILDILVFDLFSVILVMGSLFMWGSLASTILLARFFHRLLTLRNQLLKSFSASLIWSISIRS